MRPKDALGPAAVAALGASVMGSLSLVVFQVNSLGLWAILFAETYVLLYLLLMEAKKGDLSG